MANVGVAAHNIDNLGIKAILKTTGKQTAKAMVKSPDAEGSEEKEDQKQCPAETNGKEVQKKEEGMKK